MKSPIGIFDSGYGGLTVMKEIVGRLPAYDYVYLGDNARAPYGPRSFDTVYRYTLECVKWFFSMNCPLVILACNTASAKALRTIQQNDLPRIAPDKRVLGVIRPTTEMIGRISINGHVGVLATAGTVASNSYPIEIEKFFPGTHVSQHACPIWVPLIENNEHLSSGASFFIKKHADALMEMDPQIDTVLLGCTHYPLIIDQVREQLPANVKVLAQGDIVAASLVDYLERHTRIRESLSRGGSRSFFTTDSAQEFSKQARTFYGEDVEALHLDLESSSKTLS